MTRRDEARDRDEGMTLAKALNAGLRQAMEDDAKVILMGQDVGTLGGVFRVTDGLQKDFGEQRVIDSPLAESGIVGTAIGLALRGYRPVCEIQFDGFVYPAFDQIVSQLAKMRARSDGKLTLPVVIRIPVGGGIGAVEHHSESNEAYFAHTAGLRVVSCSSPGDAYRLIRGAIASDDPSSSTSPNVAIGTRVRSTSMPTGLSRPGIRPSQRHRLHTRRPRADSEDGAGGCRGRCRRWRIRRSR